MSQIDDLYNNLSEEEIATYSAGINQAERHIVVNADRSVTVPDELKRIAVQYDHDVETVTFDCPRYWDNLDMSKMAVYINYLLPGGAVGSYPCTKVTVDSTDKDIMHFDWTISRNVTPYQGQIKFLVCVKKTDADGDLVNHWNSELCEDCYISEGLEAEAIDITVEYPDVVTQLLLKMDEVTDKIPDVDDYLTIYSTNPVQNKVIAEKVKAFEKNFVDLRNQYWEAGTIDGIYSDTDIREKMTAAGGALWIKNKIWRLTFDPTGQFGVNEPIEFYGHDVIGIPYNAQGLYIIDMTTGKSYKWEVTDGWTKLTHDISGKLNFAHVANDEEAKTALDTDGIIYVTGGGPQIDHTIIQNRSPYGEKTQHKFIFGRHNGARDCGMYWRSYNHNEDAWTEWASAVDSELNTKSESPVMNKTVARAIYDINEQLSDQANAVTNAGVFSTLAGLQAYEFEECRFYKIYIPSNSDLITLLGSDYGQYWSVVYWVDRSDGNLEYLTLTSLDTGRGGTLALDNGTYSEFGGQTNTDHITLTDRATGINYILYVSNGKLTLEESEA